ncbi:MAG: hypothetical protein KGM17_13965, partial [Sphingomonadales bacterium]|nr:hypothetical protein [Sphingomonadales bacterium]
MIRSNLRLAAAPVLLLALAGGSGTCHRSADDTAQQAPAAPPPLPGALPGTLPMGDPAGLAPPVTALPLREPIRLGRLPRAEDRYAYLDRAWWLDDAMADAPPDYAFDYDGVSPWGWDYPEGGRVLVEPVAGGYRSYYYAPGADTPFYVRDPGYGYAFDGATLVGLYSARGEPLEIVPETAPVGYAARYRSRGRDLYRADAAPRRIAVTTPAWTDTLAAYAGHRRVWHEDVARNPPWRAWHESHLAQAQAVWQPRRAAREAAAPRPAPPPRPRP